MLQTTHLDTEYLEDSLDEPIYKLLFQKIIYHGSKDIIDYYEAFNKNKGVTSVIKIESGKKKRFHLFDRHILYDFVSHMSEIDYSNFKELLAKLGVSTRWQRKARNDGVKQKDVECSICASAQIQGIPLIEFLAKYIWHCQSRQYDIVATKDFEADDIESLLKMANNQKTKYIYNGMATTGGSSLGDLINDERSWLDPYNPKSIPFVGRKAEIEQLDEFANHKDNFKIWAIVAPSGAGKTRLAVHWGTSKALEDWHCQVLHKEDLQDPINWSEWSPKRPTLIIIDYMFDFKDTPMKIIKRCRKKLSHHVRLLVLDHVFSEPLQNDSRWGFSGSINSDIKNKKLFFNKNALPLTKINKLDNLIAKIISQVAKLDVSDPKIKEAITYLEETESANQPLFAALVGEAIFNKEDYSKWNRRNLIAHALGKKDQSERLPWQHDDINGKWASCFIAVATARRGIRFDQLMQSLETEITLPNDFDFKPIKNICYKFVPTSNENELKPFEPDLLGESFFLLFLKKLNDLPKIKKIFLQMFIAGDEETQIRDALAFIGFIESLTRNIFNDGEHSKERTDFLNILLGFMNPNDFSPGSPIRWAVSICLIEIAEQTYNYYSGLEDIRNYLMAVNKKDLYMVTYDEFLVISVKHIIRLFRLLCPLTLSHQELVNILKDLMRLLNRYKKTFNKNHSQWLHASIDCYLIIVKDLIDQDVYFLESLSTMLMNACQNGHVDVIRVLRSLGADIYARDEGGKTTLMIACENNQTSVVELLINYNNYYYSTSLNKNLSMVCAADNEYMSSIINHDNYLDTIDNNGWSALKLSRKIGNFDIEKILIDAGANL